MRGLVKIRFPRRIKKTEAECSGEEHDAEAGSSFFKRLHPLLFLLCHIEEEARYP